MDGPRENGYGGLMDLLRVALPLSLLVASAGCASNRPAPVEAQAAAPSSPAPAFADPTSETFEGLALGLDGAAVEQRFGAPDQKGQPQEMAATGLFESDWVWTARGLRLGMTATTADAAPTVGSIEIAGPSTLRTSRGIGIGATRAEVEAAYRDALGKGRDPSEPDATSETRLILGSVYGGTAFRFEGGKVVSIFVGASAE